MQKEVKLRIFVPTGIYCLERGLDGNERCAMLCSGNKSCCLGFTGLFENINGSIVKSARCIALPSAYTGGL